MASIATDWVKSMKLCKFHGQRPAKVNDIVNKNIWIGAAIYRGDFGKHFDYLNENTILTLIVYTQNSV